ncbi:MAG: recombinase family protein [Acidobacteriia bacterium]|nr:recombinase family protein [Terriglobia bacterium]
MKKVIELIRVSTEGQARDDRASIPAQRTINRRTAEAYGLEIVRTIELVNVSGAAVLRTPEMQTLLKLIESPDIRGVVVREFSRVMRPDNFGDYVLFQAFQDTGTVLYLPDGPLDLNSKTGKLVAGLRAIIAGNELSEIRERVWAAKEEKRRSGKLAQSAVCLPFGVGYEEKRGFFYETEAEKVREAFRLFLSGETSYVKLADMVGVTPRGMHLIMRNPIWTGWRVIDKKRDASSSARRVKADGRQGDRPKVKRSPEEVIRVRVIGAPLISEEEFRRVQQIMDAKSRLHWRSQPDRNHPFTYNGFLICAECQALIYGHFRRAHYYLCKRRASAAGSGERCVSVIMRRDKLEPKLDDLFGYQLTSRSFIGRLIGEIEKKYNSGAIRCRIARLEGEVGKLRVKRERILDSFFEGVLTREERNVRLASIEKQTRLAEEMLMRETPAPKLSAGEIATAFSPLFDWPVLGRESKRRILAATVPEIHVSNYVVSGVAVQAPVLSIGDGDTRTGRDSWPRPA